jgi:hypothetical protein
MALFSITMDLEQLGNWIAWVTVMITIFWSDLLWRWVSPHFKKKKRGCK